MNIATLLVALIATSAADTSGDPVLLDFQAAWCGPCQQMRPAVELLVQKGYPVKQIDIDRSPKLAERYRVEKVPTFIVVDAGGKELARTQGAMSPRDLALFYNETKLKTAASAPVDETQSRDDPEGTAPEDRSDPEIVNPKPWQTVVRITMHLSQNEWGYGSGTIIYSDAEESIILTCAHIFKVKGPQPSSPKKFSVPIRVDLFGGQIVTYRPAATLACVEKDIHGEAIDYDFNNDVGLIRIRPGRKLPAARVVPTTWRPQKGMPMTTVGCSHGADATAWSTKILDPRVGMSHSNSKQSFATIKCAYQPIEGRSGGGLFTSDGYVAGVCDFADPNEKVGLYAVPEAIHRLLDRNQLTALYKAPSRDGEALLAANRTRAKATAGGTKYRAQSADESANPDDITLPSPIMAGIANPPSNSRARNAAADDRRTARAPRRSTDLEVAESEPIDAGPRPGEAQTTELAGDPGADARAEDLTELPPVRTPTPEPKPSSTSTRPAGTSGWKPVRSNPADAGGPRIPSR